MIDSTKGFIDWETRSKKIYVRSMGGCCQICKYALCIQALEFHHLDPNEKDFEISNRISPRRFKKVSGELKKCIMLCSNCHKAVHAGILSIPATFAQLDEQILLNECELRINSSRQFTIPVQNIPTRTKIFFTPSQLRILLEEELNGDVKLLSWLCRVHESVMTRALNQISLMNL